MNKDTVHMSLNIPRKLRDRLKLFALKKHTTMTKIIIKKVEETLEGDK